MKKIRGRIPILIITVFIVLSCDINNSNNTKEVEFLVEREIYSIGEDITTKIINNSNVDIYVQQMTCPGFLQKEIKNKWVTLNDNCAKFTTWSYSRISENESRDILFSSERINSEGNDNTGTYRAELSFYVENDFDNEIFITSESFTIIE